ncbi:MAG: hypothetical protein IKZ88_06410 [Neisseriaceae bacterium]|nr:hypothetical protein [Neisseriaceae bacterium]
MTLKQIRESLDNINKILNFLQSLAYAFIVSLLISMIFYSFGDKSFYLILFVIISLSSPLVLLIVMYSMWLEHLEEKALSEE